MNDATYPMSIEALRARLALLPLHPSPRRHRCRMVYDLTRCDTFTCDGADLALPEVEAAGACVADFAQKRSKMPHGFWREVTVRMSSSGEVQIKLILQLPSEAALATDAPGIGREALEAAYPFWSTEQAAFIAHVQQQQPKLVGISAQLAIGTARPSKVAPCILLHGSLHLRESHAGWPPYIVGPETMSQINHVTASALVSRVGWWLGLTSHTRLPDVSSDSSASAANSVPSPAAVDAVGQGTAPTLSRAAAAAAAAASLVGAARSIVCTGRDVNLFGASLFARTSHELTIVTHCPNAYADLEHSLPHAGGQQGERGESGRKVRRYCVPKGKRTAVHLRGLVSMATSGGSASLPPEVAVVTAGRRGVGRDVCCALRDDLPIRVLVYVYCCEATMVTDLEELLAHPGVEGSGGGHSSNDSPFPEHGSRLGGFAVADAARFDHFAGSSGHVGGGLLLMRRPGACLMLPVGPAGSGKSSLCRRLQVALPRNLCTIVERDAVLASLRSGGEKGVDGFGSEGSGGEGGGGEGGCTAGRLTVGLSAAKKRTHQLCVDRLREAARTSRLCVFDSCNANAGGRRHYCDEVLGRDAELVLLISFKPTARGGVDEGSASGAVGGSCGASVEEHHRALLLERTRSRQCHPTFPPSSAPERQTAALDATIAAMEWPTREEAAALASAHGKGEATCIGRDKGRRVRLIRCDPAAPAEQTFAFVLDQLLDSFLWLVGDDADACADDRIPCWNRPPSTGYGGVRLRIGGDRAGDRVSLTIT